MTSENLNNTTQPPLPELQWIDVQTSIDDSASAKEETFKAKLKRKFGENPIVPIGCGVTAGILSYGLYSMSKGNKKTSQLMMRLRVLAQGFTVVALMAGLGMTAFKKNRQ